MTTTTIEERLTTLNFDYAAQPKEFLTHCNLSGKTDFTVIGTQDRYGFPAQACFWHDSGLVTLNPRLTAAAYTMFYKDVYRPLVSVFHGKKIDAQTVQEEQQQYSQELLNFLSPYLLDLGRRPNAFSLLDIGGSTGIVALPFVEKYQCQATILDPSPDELAIATQAGLSTVPGFLEDSANQLDKQYDLILLCKTVDHLLDVQHSLSIIKSLLSPQGRFYVDMVDFLEVARQAGNLQKAIKIDHPYSFTPPVMEAYLRQTGFEVLGKIYMLNNILVGYVCGHAPPQAEYLPSKTDIQAIWDEILRLKELSQTVS